MSSFSSHEIVVVVSIVAFEIVTIGYVAFVDVIDENILIVVFINCCAKKPRHGNN
jgi:hypothetical protein